MENDKLDIILVLMKESRDKQERQGEDLSEIKEVQISQGILIEQNELGLREHMQQTRLLKELVVIHKKELDSRLEKIEAPIKAKEIFYSWILKLGAIVGVLVGIYEAFKMFIN